MKRREWIKWIAAVCLIALVIGLAGCGGSDGAGDPAGTDSAGSDVSAEVQQTADLAQVDKETAAQLIQLLSDEDVGPGNEWSIIGIAASSLAQDAQAQALFVRYEENLRLQVKRAKGVLDTERPTDNARAAIAMQKLGEDPSDVEGYDLLAQLEDKKAVKEQGINAEIWALNAASCCGRKLDASKEYVNDILGMQLEDGGITYDGKTMDVDITAMAVQALAPLAKDDSKIGDAVNAALDWLSGEQGEAGDYGNSESTSQVIIAVGEAGEDPAAAEAFVKDGGTLIDGQLLYRCPEGFSHLQGDEMDVMATEQALCAIDSALLATQGEKLF